MVDSELNYFLLKEDPPGEGLWTKLVRLCSMDWALRTFLSGIGVVLRSTRKELQIALMSVIDDIPKLFRDTNRFEKFFGTLSEKQSFRPVQVAAVTLFIFVLDLINDLGHVVNGTRSWKRFWKNRLDSFMALFIGSFLISWGLFFTIRNKEAEIKYWLLIVITIASTMTIGLISDQITLWLFHLPREERLELACSQLGIDQYTSAKKVNRKFLDQMEQFGIEGNLKSQVSLKWNMLVVKEYRNEKLLPVQP